jgi:hypothetical protein
MDDKVLDSRVDRRSFLRGSALFAAALGLGAAGTAFAQEPPPQQPKPEEEKKEQPPDDGGGQNETLIDADGREYRVCPQCASNMYRQGRTWTCENCGYSYVE